MGKLYRQMKDVSDEEKVATSELGFVAMDIRYDKDLEIAGSEAFIEEAWNFKY